jgi:hypothetical protein
VLDFLHYLTFTAVVQLCPCPEASENKRTGPYRGRLTIEVPASPKHDLPACQPVLGQERIDSLLFAGKYPQYGILQNHISSLPMARLYLIFA